MGFQVHLTGSGDLVAQVDRQVREAILEGRLRPRERLPPSRELARSAAVPRNTVSTAYERLIAEGFATARVGSGTYVDGTAVQARPYAALGLVMLAACALFATTAGTVSPWFTGAVLVGATILRVLAEMLQAAGSWEISFGVAPDGQHGAYQGMYNSGIPLARILGPAALTGLILGHGAAGWLVLVA
jgi:Bacterial regulatory proteins, gntR family